MQLINQSQNKILASHVEVAKSLPTRMLGLMGRESLATDQCMWIHNCNSIHTFFMRFAIDVIFLDREMKVVEIRKNLSPWKLVLPIWRARSVVEFATLNSLDVKVGDILHVGH